MKQIIAMIAAIILPFFNIPLIIRMKKRKSSEDISVVWALGVWICIILMAPQAFTSTDIVFRIFSLINFVLFTLVMINVLYYKKKKN